MSGAFLALKSRNLPSSMAGMLCMASHVLFVSTVFDPSMTYFFVLSCFSEGESFVHIMDECYGIVPVAHGIQKNSLFKKSLGLKIRQLREAGLLDKFISDASNDLANQNENIFKGETRKTEPLTLGMANRKPRVA